MGVLSLFDMDVFLRDAGADRVGEDASAKLAELLEDVADDLVSRAKVFARHANRNYVTRADILLAAGYTQ